MVASPRVWQTALNVGLVGLLPVLFSVLSSTLPSLSKEAFSPPLDAYIFRINFSLKPITRIRTAMDFSGATSSPSPFSSSSSTLSGNRGGSGRDRRCSMGSQIARRLFCGMVTCIFATVGFLAGAVTGGLIGLATESGVFRGIGVGAISGALFSMEVVEKSVTLWHSNESGILSILYVIDIICSLLSGRLVREKVDPAVQSAVQSQMSAVSSPFREALDIFETGGVQGMEKASVDRLPKIKITMENKVDASGERIGCAVCLQDFQIGETARRLPHCRHIFHLPCIDSWLIKHGSCPLCRRDF